MDEKSESTDFEPVQSPTLSMEAQKNDLAPPFLATDQEKGFQGAINYPARAVVKKDATPSQAKSIFQRFSGRSLTPVAPAATDPKKGKAPMNPPIPAVVKDGGQAKGIFQRFASKPGGTPISPVVNMNSEPNSTSVKPKKKKAAPAGMTLDVLNPPSSIPSSSSSHKNRVSVASSHPAFDSPSPTTPTAPLSLSEQPSRWSVSPNTPRPTPAIKTAGLSGGRALVGLPSNPKLRM